MSRGLLIAFEGGEASGKSTQAELLAKELDAVLTREPGGTPYGERARELFQLDTSVRIIPRAEALLVASSRAQHVTELVEPTLASGRDVVTDRFIASSLAYQGFGRGLDVDDLMKINMWATNDLEADLTILIDIPKQVARERRGGEFDSTDRFEIEEEEFHERISDGYHQLALANSESWRIIDGNGEIDVVSERVYSAVKQWKENR